MPETRVVADEDFAWAERVSIRAAGRRVGDPLAGRRLHQLADHSYEPRTKAPTEQGSVSLDLGPIGRFDGGLFDNGPDTPSASSTYITTIPTTKMSASSEN
jgi:hypothetical protein